MVLKWLNHFVERKTIKPMMEIMNFPCKFPSFAKIQDNEKSLIKDLKKNDHKYGLTKLERTLVLTINGEIFILVDIPNYVIAWYDEYICHPGAMRTEATI
jgi:lysophospholipase L1-like esterase